MKPLVPWSRAADAPPAARLLEGAALPRGLDEDAYARVAQRLQVEMADASPAPSASGRSLVAKIVGGVIVGAAIGVIAWSSMSDRAFTKGTDAPAPVDVSGATSLAPPVAEAARGPIESKAGDDIRRESVPVRSVGDLPSATTPAVRRAPPVVDALTLELRLVDGARVRLASDPTSALSLLDAHARDFPRGQLALERDVLRVDALLRLGRRSDAEAVARSLAGRAPGSPQAERASDLMGRVE
ncbi:MAG: hypothetical protein BGO98_35125 [Myxococcales bacterium 68-20]|nr:MAG: hypothetical protein BGO98_35125 [Myxococcales bacterium 68-20]